MRGCRTRSGLIVLCAAACVAVLLAACTVRLVSDYDPQIDAGLSQLNTDLTAFVNKMIDESGTPQGTWAANKDFYTTEEAKTDTLIVRAEAHKALNSCPSTEMIADALSKAAPGSEAASYVGRIPKGDCSVVLLQLIKSGIVDLERFHTAQGRLGIPASAHDPILVGGLGSLIRSGIIVELAKKNAQTTISAGGQ